MMNALDNHPFLKMNGLGNEIVVLDLRGSAHRVTPGEARAIAADDRSAFDQLMVIHDPVSAGTDGYVRIFNTDGSMAGACGNGTRCVAWALDHAPGRDGGAGRSVVETEAGLLECRRIGDLFYSVDMGPPELRWDRIPLARPVDDTAAFDPGIGVVAPFGFASAASMGNPHIVFVVPSLAGVDLARLGPIVEYDPLFPERVNASFVEVVDRRHIRLAVWERGAGPTRACGTAACAAAVSMARRGLTDRTVTVTLPGGDLDIEWRERDGHVIMAGAVELEWEGRLRPELFAASPELAGGR